MPAEFRSVSTCSMFAGWSIRRHLHTEMRGYLCSRVVAFIGVLQESLPEVKLQNDNETCF